MEDHRTEVSDEGVSGDESKTEADASGRQPPHHLDQFDYIPAVAQYNIPPNIAGAPGNPQSVGLVPQTGRIRMRPAPGGDGPTRSQRRRIMRGINVHIPNGQRAYTRGGIITINWTSQNLTGPGVTISLVRNGVQKQLFTAQAQSGPNANMHVGNLQQNLQAAMDYEVRVEDNGDPTVFGQSAQFPILDEEGEIEESGPPGPPEPDPEAIEVGSGEEETKDGTSLIDFTAEDIVGRLGGLGLPDETG